MKPGSLLACFLCVLLHILGEKLYLTWAGGVSVQTLERIEYQSSRSLGRQPLQVFRLKKKQVESVGVLTIWRTYNIIRVLSAQKIGEEKSNNDWSSVLSVWLYLFNFLHLISIVIKALEYSTIYNTVVPVMVQVFFYCVTTAIYCDNHKSQSLAVLLCRRLHLSLPSIHNVFLQL